MPHTRVAALLEKARRDPQSLTIEEYEQLVKLRMLRNKTQDTRYASRGRKPKAAGPSDPDPDARYLFDREEIAQIVGASVRTVNRLVQRGEIARPVGQGHNTRWDIRDVVLRLQERIVEATRATLASQEERYRAAKASLAELELDRETSRVVDIDQVQRKLAPAVVNCRTAILAMPDRLALLVPPDLRDEMTEEARSLCAGVLRDCESAFRDLAQEAP